MKIIFSFSSFQFGLLQPVYQLHNKVYRKTGFWENWIEQLPIKLYRDPSAGVFSNP